MKQSTKYKILFVCLGNICRSPMAEFIFRKIVSDQGYADFFEIASAATSDEETGNPVYPPAKRILAQHEIACNGKTARQLTKEMYDHYDLVIGMEQSNVNNIRRMVGDYGDGKIYRLLDFVSDDKLTNNRRDIADPWYTRDFETAWNEILLGCQSLFEYLTDKEN